MGSRDGDEAVTEMVRVLGLIANRAQQLQAKSLDWSCWATAAHVATICSPTPGS
jgi:hypothetical protein